MRERGKKIISTLLFAAASAIFAAAPSPTPEITGELTAHVSLDLRSPIEPINRKVLGACLMFPPFSDELIAKAKPFLKGSSVRIWLHKWTDAKEMENVMEFARKCGVAEILTMNPMVKMPNIVAKYNSETDNNLPLAHMQPKYLANMMKFLASKQHPGFPKGYPITGFEILNEPQFPQNGAWSSGDYARYALDVSKAIRNAAPTMELGVCLRSPRKYVNWNRDMLMNVAAVNPAAVDFVIHHPYDFFWIKARKTIGDYYARVGGLDVHKEELEKDLNLIKTIGHGRWRMALTEWNTHPPGYKPPTSVSRDLAVAISMASAIQTYWEIGVDSAHYFVLKDKYRDGGKAHFALIDEKPDGTYEYNPTYHVMRLYGEKAHGIRIRTTCGSPTYDYPTAWGKVKTPIVKATSIFDFKRGELKLLLVNRHMRDPIEATIDMKNFRATADFAEIETVTGKTPTAEVAVLNKRRIALTKKFQAPLTITLPPHSITAVTIEGKRPLTERERVSKLLSWVTSWNICGIFEGLEKKDHSLCATLPCATTPDFSKKYRGFDKSTAGWSKIQANQSGFVNFFEPYLIIGLDKKIRENLQGTAISYIWSPSKRKCAFSFGADYWGMVFLNDKTIIDQRHTIGGQPAPDKIRGTATLEPGWNTISVRVASGSGGMGFWLALENRGDLIFSAEKRKKTKIPNNVILFPTLVGCVNAWSKNRNQNPKLEVSGNPATRRIVFLKWTLPQGATPKNLLKAKITINRSYEKNPGNLRLIAVSETWSPDSLKYENMPKTAGKKVISAKRSKNGWIFEGADLTQLARSWLENPDKNNGVAILADSTDGYAGIANKKRERPKLILEFAKEAK